MPTPKGWWSTEVDDTNIHTHPHNDLIDHDLDGDCICLPDVETVERGDGEIVFLTHHHSIDGREAQEVKHGVGERQQSTHNQQRTRTNPQP